MLDSIVTATPADLEALWQLYADVCAQQEHDAYTPNGRKASTPPLMTFAPTLMPETCTLARWMGVLSPRWC